MDDMTYDVRRIHQLIDNLSEAIYKEARADISNWPEIVFSQSPQKTLVIVAWKALTDPSNAKAFADYERYWDDTELSEYAKSLYGAIRTEIARRATEEQG